MPDKNYYLESEPNNNGVFDIANPSHIGTIDGLLAYTPSDDADEESAPKYHTLKDEREANKVARLARREEWKRQEEEAAKRREARKAERAEMTPEERSEQTKKDIQNAYLQQAQSGATPMFGDINASAYFDKEDEEKRAEQRRNVSKIYKDALIVRFSPVAALRIFKGGAALAKAGSLVKGSLAGLYASTVTDLSLAEVYNDALDILPEGWIGSDTNRGGAAAAAIGLIGNYVGTKETSNPILGLVSEADWAIHGFKGARSEAGFYGKGNALIDKTHEKVSIPQVGQIKRDVEGRRLIDEEGNWVEETPYNELGFWGKLNTPTFANSFIESSGFTLGMVTAGKNVSKVASAIPLQRAAKLSGKTVEQLLEGGFKFSKKTQLAINVASSTFMANGEAIVESHNAVRDYIARNKEVIDQAYLAGELDAGQYQIALKNIQKNAVKNGTLVYLCNLAILIPSVFFSYSPMLTRAANKTTHAGLKNILNMFGGGKNAVERSGGSIARDELGRISSDNMGRAFKNYTKEAGGVALMMFSEGNEEFQQNATQHVWEYTPSLGSYYEAYLRQDGKTQASNLLGAILKAEWGAIKGDYDSYVEAASGALMGLFGSPNAEYNNGRVKFSWEGGLSETVRNINEYNEQRAASDAINRILADPKNRVATSLKELVGLLSDELDAKLALAAKNDFEYENARERALIRTLFYAEKLGMTDELFGPIADVAEKMTLEDVNNLKVDGVITNDNVSPEEFQKSVNDFGKKLKKMINLFKADMNAASQIFSNLSEEELSTYVYGRAAIRNWDKRAEKIKNEFEEKTGKKFEEIIKDKKALNELFAQDPTLVSKYYDYFLNRAASAAYTMKLYEWAQDPNKMRRELEREHKRSVKEGDEAYANALASAIQEATSKDDVLGIIREAGLSDKLTRRALRIAEQRGSQFAREVREERGVRGRLAKTYTERSFKTSDGRTVPFMDFFDKIISYAREKGKSLSNVTYEEIDSLAKNEYGIAMQSRDIIGIMSQLGVAEMDNRLLMSAENEIDVEPSLQTEGQGAATNSIEQRNTGAAQTGAEQSRSEVNQRQRAAREARRERSRRAAARRHAEQSPTAAVDNNNTMELVDGSIVVKNERGEVIEGEIADEIKRARGQELKRRIASEFYDEEWQSLSEVDKRLVAESILNDCKNRFGIEMVLVKDENELAALPEKVRDEIEKGSVGLFSSEEKKTYIYLPEVASVKDIAVTYLHEVGGHYGLRTLLGNRRYSNMCIALWSSLESDKQNMLRPYFNEVLREYGQDVLNDDGERGKLLGDELFARLAEDMINNEGDYEGASTWNVITSTIRSLLRDKLGLKISYNKNDLKALITKSLNNLAKGKTLTEVSNDELRASILKAREDWFDDRIEFPDDVKRLINEYGTFVRSDAFTNSTNVELKKDYNGIINEDILNALGKAFHTPVLVVRNLEDFSRIHIYKSLYNDQNSRWGGYYNPLDGLIYIFNNKYNTINRLSQPNYSSYSLPIIDAFFHELSHKALRNLFNSEEDLKKFYELLWNNFELNADPDVEALHDRIVREYDSHYTSNKKINFGNEAFAYLTKLNLTHEGFSKELNNITFDDVNKFDDLLDRLISSVATSLPTGTNSNKILFSALLRERLSDTETSSGNFKIETGWMKGTIRRLSNGKYVYSGKVENYIDRFTMIETEHGKEGELIRANLRHRLDPHAGGYNILYANENPIYTFRNGERIESDTVKDYIDKKLKKLRYDYHSTRSRKSRRAQSENGKLHAIIRDKINGQIAELYQIDEQRANDIVTMVYDMFAQTIGENNSHRITPDDIKKVIDFFKDDLTEEDFEKLEMYSAIHGQWDKYGAAINESRAILREHWAGVLSLVSDMLSSDYGISISMNMLSRGQFRKLFEFGETTKEFELVTKEELDDLLEQYDAERERLIDSEADDEVDYNLKEEYFDFKVRMTDEDKTLSTRVKLELSNLVNLDKDGRATVSEYTGLSRKQNRKYIYNVIVEATADSRNEEEFFTKLASLSDKFGWARDLAMKIDSDPDFKADLYSNLFKTAVVPTVLDSNTGKISKYSELTSLRFRGRLIYENLGISPTEGAIYGQDGKVRDVNAARGLILEIEDFEEMVRMIGALPDGYKEKMVEFFGKLGLSLSVDDIAEVDAYEFNLEAMRDFVQKLIDGKVDNAARLEAAKKLRRFLEINERTTHSGMLRLNGVGYAAHVPMSYLEHRLLNLTKGTVQEIAAYVDSEFGAYDNFASADKDGRTYFFTWLQELSRGQNALSYEEIMSINGKAPEKSFRSVDEYISTMFQIYLSDKKNETFLLPCLGHSGRMITVKHQGRMTESEIRDGLVYVLLREIKLARIQRNQGKDIGATELGLLPELKTLLKQGKVKSGDKVLSLDDLLNDGDTLQIAYDCVDALINEVKSVEISADLAARWSQEYAILGKNKNDSFKTTAEFEDAYRAFRLANYFAQIQLSAIIGADPAFFSGDMLNYSKRLQGLQSCNWRPMSGDEEMGVTVLKTEPVDCLNRPGSELSFLIDEYERDGMISKQAADKLRKKASKVDTTDGQSYMTLETYMEYLEKMGKSSEALRKNYEAAMNWQMSEAEFREAFTPLKLAGYGEYVEEVEINGKVRKIKRPYMIKTSFMPIMPCKTGDVNMPGAENAELQLITAWMEKTGSKIACYDSAVKVGPNGEVTGQMLREGNATKPTFTIKYWELGMQQTEYTEATNEDITSGRQKVKLALSKAREMKGITLNGETYTGEQIEQIYLNALAAKAQKLYSAQMEKALADKEALSESIKRMSEETADQSGVNGIDDAIESGLPLFMSAGQRAVQGALLSLIKSRVVAAKQYGQVLVQCSSHFTDDLHLVISKDKNGRRYIAGMECYLPAPSEEFIKRYATVEDGVWKIDVEKLPEGLRKSIGTRIPTAGYGAMKVLYVKGFLNPTYGSQIFLPAEATIFDGSDFDIDKIFTVQPNFVKNPDGTLSKLGYEIPKNLQNFDNLSVKQIDNLLSDITEAIWASPVGTSQILSSGNYDCVKQAKELQKKIDAQLSENAKAASRNVSSVKWDTDKMIADVSSDAKHVSQESAYNALSPEAAADAYFKGQLGKSIIGVIAASNAFVPYIRRSGGELGGLTIKLGGDTFDVLCQQNGKFGYTPDVLLGSKIDAAADMKKDDCLYVICKDGNQVSLSIVMSMLGIDPVHELIFLNHPVIKKIIESHNGRRMTGYSIMKAAGLNTKYTVQDYLTKYSDYAMPSWGDMLKAAMGATDLNRSSDEALVVQFLKLFYISQAVTQANLMTSRFDKADKGSMISSTMAGYMHNLMRIRMLNVASKMRHNYYTGKDSDKIPAYKTLKDKLMQISFDENGEVDIKGSRDRQQATLYKLIFEDMRVALSTGDALNGVEASYPYLSDWFLSQVEMLYREFGSYEYSTGEWSSSMTEEMLDSFLTEWVQYLWQHDPNMCKWVGIDEYGLGDTQTYTGRDALVRMSILMPYRIEKARAKSKGNLFLTALERRSYDNGFTKYIVPNMDGLTRENIRGIKKGWADLLNVDREFAINMYRYATLVSPKLLSFAPSEVVDAYFDENGGYEKSNVARSIESEDAIKDFMERWTIEHAIEFNLIVDVPNNVAPFKILEAQVNRLERTRGKTAAECNEITVISGRNGECPFTTANGRPSSFLTWDGYLFKLKGKNASGNYVYERETRSLNREGQMHDWNEGVTPMKEVMQEFAIRRNIALAGGRFIEDMTMDDDVFFEEDPFEESSPEENFAEEFVSSRRSDEENRNDLDRSKQTFVFFDTETTDLIDENTLQKKYPNIFQIGYIVTDGNMKEKSRGNILIKPNGWRISDEAAKVTGVTTEQLAANKDAVAASEAFKAFADVLKDATHIVGHNVEFDLRVLAREFQRNGLGDPVNGKLDLHIIDTMKSSYPNKLKDMNGRNKYWTNVELYNELNKVKFSGKAHNAMSDIETTKANFEVLREKGYINTDKIDRKFRSRKSRKTSFTVDMSNDVSIMDQVQGKADPMEQNELRGCEGKNLC